MNFFNKKSNKYYKLVLNLAAENLQKTVDKDNKELGEVYKNVLFGNDGPKSLTNVKLSREDNFITNKLFRPLSEIVESYESIQNIPVYLSIFPYKKKGISKSSYLKYNVENYLHELNILQLRLESYLVVINRAYKKSKIKSILLSKSKKLNDLIKGAFSGYILTRGRHVHQFRYTDDSINRLSLLDLLVHSPEKKFAAFIDWQYEEAYKKIRKEWREKIKNDCKSIDALLDVYFKTLYKVLVTNGKLTYPWNNNLNKEI